MSTTYLGPRFEIHAGGADLIFPHHESEIAQSEAATGERPFVEWWMHAGMLHHEGAKMSKSLRNLVLVRDLLRDHSGDAIRHYLVSHHYRTEVHFDAGALDRSALAASLLRAASVRGGEDPVELAPALADARDRFLAAMDDDLDTPTAIAELEAIARRALEADDEAQGAQAGWLVRELGGRILGLRLATVPERSPVAA
jgi:cysteinyl-tRNA synthetase